MTLIALVDAVIKDQAEALTPLAATFPDVLTALHVTRYTGRVYVDFAEGRPKVVSLPQPLGVRISN